MKKMVALLAVLAGVALASPALASDISAKDPDGVLKALGDLGYRGTLQTGTDGWTSIELVLSGLKSYIYFDNCDDDKKECESLLFNFGMDLTDGSTLEKVNEWNYNTLHGFTYLDKNNDPWLAMAVRTGDGISSDLFADTLKTWDNRIGDVKEFFGF